MKAFLALIIMISLNGCGQNNSDKSPDKETAKNNLRIFDTLTESREWGDCETSDLGCITLSFEYPKLNDSVTDADQINQIILKNLLGNLRDSLTTLAEFGDTYINEYQQYLAQQKKDKGGWQIEHAVNVVYADNLILSLRHESFENRGGTHPIMNLSLRSYLAESGKRIVLEDLFAGEYRDLLEGLCREQLRQTLEANLSLNSSPERISQITSSFSLKDHFLITASGIKFFVTEKETISLESDLIEFEVSFDQLAALGIVNQNGPLASLLSKPIL